MVAGKKVAQLIAARGPPGAEDSYSFKRRPIRCTPIIEQVIKLRIKVVLGRIPRLHEKVVDIGFVYGTNGSAGVGIRSQQCTLSVREDLHSLLKKFNSVHVRHALISKQQGDAVIADFQLLEKVECFLRRVTSNYSIFGSVLRSEVAFDGPQDIGIIIHAQ